MFKPVEYSRRLKVMALPNAKDRGRSAMQRSQTARKYIMESAWQPTVDAKLHVHSTYVVSHTRASIYTEVDVRTDKNMFTFLCILLLLSGLSF
jgi:hypothetical protein